MTVRNFYYNFKNKLGLYELIKQLDPNKLWRIRVDEFDEKTRLQEEKYHAMLGDIAKQAKHLNQVLDLDSWKRLCVKQFADDCIEQDIPRLADYWKKNEVKLMPSLDGRSLVALGQQTRDFPKYVAAGFITWLYAYGANNDVVWSEPEEQFNERYAA
jgi:hypothetical protein